MNPSSIHRLVHSLVVLACFSFLFGCGKDDSSSATAPSHDRKMKDGRFASIRWPETGSFQYNYTETNNNGTCTTGALQFSSKAEYCMGLTVSKLNSNCALETRKSIYLRDCGSDFEEYPAPAPVQPVPAPMPVPAPTAAQPVVPPPPYVVPAVGDKATYTTTRGTETSPLSEEVMSVDLQNGTYLVQVIQAGLNGQPTTLTHKVTMRDEVVLATAAASAENCSLALIGFQGGGPRPWQFANLETVQYRGSSLQTCHIRSNLQSDWWFARVPFALLKKEFRMADPRMSMTADLISFEKH